MPKYLQLSVPEFNTDGSTPMTSYLRLGSVVDPTTAGSAEVEIGSATGEDLAAKVVTFADDSRRRCAEGVDPEPAMETKQLKALLAYLEAERETEKQRYDFLLGYLESLADDPEEAVMGLVAQVEASETVMAELQEQIDAEQAKHGPSGATATDDSGLGPPNYCTEYIAPSQREAVTKTLHTRGGWRDHTDGNRITTTRGDKVEVVGGNYRMVVLGREAQPVNAAGESVLPGWDISGGHVSKVNVTSGGLDRAILPDGTVAESKIEWVKNWDGTWRDKSTQIKGDTETTTIGDTISYSYAKTETSVTGSETPTATYPNPVVEDRTWVELMESYTGSKAAPVPLQYDETWAERVHSKTNVKTMVDFTKARTTSSKTIVEQTSDITVADTMTSTTIADNTTDLTICDSQTTLTKGDTYATTVGDTSDTFVGARSTTTVGVSTSISISSSTDITCAAKSTITVGATGDATIGVTTSLTLGPTFSCSIGPKAPLAIGKTELALMKLELSGQRILV